MRRWAPCLVLVLACACSSTGGRARADAAASESEAEALAAAVRAAAEARGSYRVSPGDLLAITVYQDPDLSRKTRVDADGTISLPLVGAVKVGGATIQEAQALLAQRLDGYLVSPQVSLLIEEYGNKQLYVMGEVQRPGSYPVPVESRMTVLQAISAAGGLTRIAAPARTRVLRSTPAGTSEFRVDVRALTRNQEGGDLLLQPNDVVFVPQSFF